MNRLLFIGGLLFVVVAASAPNAQVRLKPDSTTDQWPEIRLKPDTTSDQALVDKYCVTCHNARMLSGNLSLAGLDVVNPAEHPEIFEKVIRKVRAGLMPPAGMPRSVNPT